MELSGTSAIITGGASGIGRSLCSLLARHGAYVVMADINFEQLEKEILECFFS